MHRAHKRNQIIIWRGHNSLCPNNIIINKKLVYWEIFNDPENAILREKQIKAGSRNKKIELIKGINPEWKDLYDIL